MCGVCGMAANSAGAQRAARQAQVDAANSMGPGYTAVNPVVIGEINEADPIHVRVLKPFMNLKERSAVYVTGDGVLEQLENGTLYDLKNARQAQRVWAVNGRPYPDYDMALRVAKALNTTPVEIA